jgi:hypothetical protein
MLVGASFLLTASLFLSKMDAYSNARGAPDFLRRSFPLTINALAITPLFVLLSEKMLHSGKKSA